MNEWTNERKTEQMNEGMRTLKKNNKKKEINEK
jgi:hypothetical protein